MDLFTAGAVCGLIALIAAGVVVGLSQTSIKGQKHPRWLISGLSLIACGGLIIYGSLLLGSLYLEMTRLVTVFSRVP